MASVVPNYDRDRVRTADIKKLIIWYGILRQFAPDVFVPQQLKSLLATAEEAANEEAPVAEAKEKPPKASERIKA